MTAGLMMLLSGCGDDAGAKVAAVSPTELIEELPKEENVSGDGESSSENNISADSREKADNVTADSALEESQREGKNPEEGVPESGEKADSSVLSGTGSATQEKDSDGKAQKGNVAQEASKTEGEKQDTGDSLQESFPEDGIDITVSAAGDATLGNHRDQEYWYTFDQTYDQAEDKGYFFANVQSIFEEDDFTILNLEGPLTTSENAQEGTYIIKGRPEYAKLLKNASVEAVSMGNNHRLDYGEEGTQDTVQALTEEGIVYAYDSNTGMYETSEGIRIGFVSVNEVYWGAGVEKTLEQGISQLREAGADLVFACCHWGIERDNYPEDYQTTLGRKCIDWGADLVIGHHPHVLQGIDQYKGKYIIYSLGNFCFGANRNPEDKDTMIFQQTFTLKPAADAEGLNKDTGDGGKQGTAESGKEGVAQEQLDAEDSSRTQTNSEDNAAGESKSRFTVVPGEAKIIPCSISSTTSRNNFQPTPLSGENAKRVIGRINEYSAAYGVSADEDGILHMIP